MEINKRLFALALVPVLGLFGGVSSATASELPLDSGNGITPVIGEIKNRNQCDGAAFFKNIVPGLTNGNVAGVTDPPIEFIVDGQTILMYVSWEVNNSFAVRFEGGYATKNGVTANNQNFIYDYTSSPVDGISDTQLNYYGEGLSADDVNHLDLCLATLDTEAPVVGDIIVEPLSDDGTTVTGLISIITSITDDSEQTVTIELLDSSGTAYTSFVSAPETSACDPVVAGCTTYTYTLDTSEIPEGDYTIRITSTDNTILAESSFKTKNITVVRSLENCLEGGDAIPTGEDGDGGCFQFGVNLEYPEALRSQDTLPILTVLQGGVRAKASAQTQTCGLAADGTVLYDYLAKDPRVDDDGNVIDPRPLDLKEIFEINEHFDEFHPGEPYPDSIVDDTTYGAVCIALYHQDAPDFEFLAGFLPQDFFLGFSLNAFLQNPADNPRPVSVLTQGPEDVPGMFAGRDRLTAPLSFCDLSDPSCGPLPGCMDDPAVECYQPSQQFVERAVVQPDNILLLVRQFAFDGTFEVYNRARTTGFKGTFGVLNTRRACPALEAPDSPFVPGTEEYLQAELDCMVLQTLEVFYDTETAINEADARGNLISPDVTRLLNHHSKALGQIKNAHFERGLRYLDDLLDEIYRATWNIDEYNDPGRLIMMVKALIFQVELHLETEGCLEDPACIATVESQP